MTQTTTEMLHARVDSKIKKKAAHVLADIGLDMSEAIRLYLKAIINARGIPFDVRVPNAETRKAMEDARLGRNLRSFSSKDEFFRTLKGR